MHKVYRTYQINQIHQIQHVYTRHTRSGIFAEYSLVPTWYTWVQPVWYKHTHTPVVQHWLMITTHTNITPVLEENMVW